MDKKLKGLFGYQKFEGNSKLDKLIAETESRVGIELNDEELDMVNAAGAMLGNKTDLEIELEHGKEIFKPNK